MTVVIPEWLLIGVGGGVAINLLVWAGLQAYDEWWVNRELRRRDRREAGKMAAVHIERVANGEQP